jgi:hypothetical protein
MFAGVVAKIEKSFPPNQVAVHIYSMLYRAHMSYVVPYPSALKYTNKDQGYSAESVVRELLANAHLGDLNQEYTGYIAQPTGFAFAVLPNSQLASERDVGLEIKLKTRLQAIQEIGEMLNWKIWCDWAGRIYFKKRYPFVMNDPEPASPPDENHPNNVQSFLKFSKANGNIIKCSYSRTTENTRNQVFVEGWGHMVYMEEEDSHIVNETNKYPLPQAGKQYIKFGNNWGTTGNYGASFRQGAAIISGAIISDQTQNELLNSPSDTNPIVIAVDRNLDKANRITELCNLTAPGDYRFHAIQCNNGSGTPGTAVTAIAAVTDDFSSGKMTIVDSNSNGNWFVRSMSSTWNRNSYVCELGLSR